MLLITAAIALAISAIRPNGRFNWLMETLPAIVGGLLLAATYRRFRFTTLVYLLAWVYALVMITGGHYTYAEVPLGNWARDAFGLSRNHFDRIGHFLQGLVPALFARELLLRTSPLRPCKWLAFICICIALGVSAGYELFEWQYAVLFGGQKANDFLGSQGDIWDAQKDMFMALIGALAALLLSPLQDHQLRCLQQAGPRTVQPEAAE